MLFQERYARERGIELRWVRDSLNLDEWAAAIDEHTRFVYGEMPSNPSIDLFDIPAVAELAHAFEAPLIVDSTVATPALLRPLSLGADIVIHSVSKSMATSGFAIAGAVVARHDIVSKIGPEEMRANFAMYVKLLPFRDHGPGLSPFNSLMIINDLRTLRRRMDSISANCQTVAEYLEAHAAVEMVAYPGLETHDGTPRRAAGYVAGRRGGRLRCGGEPVRPSAQLHGARRRGGGAGDVRSFSR
jgi:O-acetylhomoserine/O-acetylserine sulfhydrylase-like pyridoxal-dependent enzyme